MVNFMNFVINNWATLVTFIFVIILAGQKIVEFISLPTKSKIAEVKERLLIWVADAEKDLGSSTGVLKLSQVYDKFCAEFPYLKKWITVAQFDNYVKEALVKVEEILANKSAKLTEKV